MRQTTRYFRSLEPSPPVPRLSLEPDFSNNKSNTLRRRQWNVWKFGSWKLVFLLVESERAPARVWLIPDAPRVALAQAWGRCGHGATETQK